MRAKIIETTTGGLWLKVIVAVLEPHEINHPSALPYNTEHKPGVPLLQLERKTQTEDVWILDLSTREGAAFSPGQNPRFAMDKIHANL